MEQSVNTVEHDKLDAISYRDTYDEAESLQISVRDNMERLDTVKELAEDLYYSLYKYAPKLQDKDEIAPTHRANHAIVDRAMGAQEYDKLRTYTQLDEFSSALATVSIMDKAIGDLPQDELSDINEQARKATEAGENLESLTERLEGLNLAQDAGADVEDQIQGTTEAMAQAQAQAQASNEALDGQIEGISGVIRRAVRDGLDEAEKDVKEISEFCQGWGSEQGSLTRLTHKEKFALAHKIRDSERLKRIAVLIGRLKRLALGKRKTRVTRAPEEVCDVEQGDELSRLLPSEYSLLMDPETEILFYRKYSAKSLLQYRLQGKERAGQGPIIACIDSSYSMGYDRDAWAKAVTLALLEVAKRERRAFAAVIFGSEEEKLTFEFLPDQPTDERLQQVLELAEFAWQGGTDFETPLNEAVDILEVSEFKKGDIVFITDGEAAVSDEFMERFRRVQKSKNFGVQGVLIGDEGSEDSLNVFCESVHSIAEIVSGSVRANRAAEEVFTLLQ